MILWIALALMTAAAAALLCIPLLRRSGTAAPRADYDREVYRDQLAELDRDAARGLIGESETAAARAEIARRLIASADRPDAKTAPRLGSGSGRIVAALAIAAPAAALALYLALGAPELATRTTSGPPADMAALVAELAEKMKDRPGDLRGWLLLGRSYRSLERFDAAADALGHASALAPDDAALAAEFGEVLIFAADGRVGKEARDAFEAALRVDAKEPRARYYLGLADAQDGNPRGALERWLALEADSAPDAPWRAMLAEHIQQLQTEAGITPENRTAMIRGMVERLAERLAQQPDDADGWLRLARSYMVLGEAAKAKDALAKAEKLRPDDAGVKALATELDRKTP